MALTDNLISYWTLDEASGTRVDSVVGSGNDLTDGNTVTQETGKINGAAHFAAASSEVLTHVSNASLQTGDIDFTITCWTYLDTKPAAVMAIVGKYGGTVQEYLLDYNNVTDRLTWIITAATAVKADQLGSPATATWYFVVVDHDATANTFSIQVNNGTPDSAADVAITANAAEFAMGACIEHTALFFDGRIDEVGFWKRVLTTQERTDLYNAGAGLAYPFASATAARRSLALLGVG